MSYRCLWCHCDIMNFKDARVFLKKSIHNDCFKKLAREFKKQFGIDLNHVRFQITTYVLTCPECENVFINKEAEALFTDLKGKGEEKKGVNR